MKRFSLLLLVLISVAGCVPASPPSAIERALYTVTTNYQTQMTPVAVIGSNSVVTATNYITNVFATYELHPKESVVTGIQAGGTIAGGLGFGLGGAIASLVLGALSAWAAWKNKRKGELITVLGQNIETASAIFKSINPTLDPKFKREIKAQQVEAGVKAEAAVVADEQVSTVKAEEAATRVNKGDVVPTNGQ